jgi:hypothetical protein
LQHKATQLFNFRLLENFMKNYVGLSRDHSGSMRSIARAAARDYNDNIASIREASLANNQDTVVSVVKCGHGSRSIVHREIVNSNVNQLSPILENAYQADANGTPLFDSVMELIDIMSNVPDASDPEVSFLVMATTDGEDNDSRTSAAKLAERIRKLQNTDRWTFVFRVPRGYGRRLIQLGIPSGNIFEWDQTEKGVQVAAQANREAFTQYFSGRALGEKSSTKFYANLADVNIKEVKTALTDISSQVQFIPVTQADNQSLIRPFVEAKLGEAMVRGGAFYQLVKTEPKVQANKRIAIREKSTGAVYAGDAARQMLALPVVGTVRLAPDDLGDFEVYIQSTSVNRKLDAGTNLLYWKQVGKAFLEGPSAR